MIVRLPRRGDLAVRDVPHGDSGQRGDDLDPCEPQSQPGAVDSFESLLLGRVSALLSYWDTEVRNVIANAAFEQFFGLNPGQAQGRHLREILGPDLYRHDLGAVQAVLGGVEQPLDRTLLDTCGTVRHLQVTMRPDLDEQGVVRGFVIEAVDVSARVSAERARDQARALFDVGMANAPFGMAVLDADARILQVNSALADVLGRPAAALIGVDVRGLVAAADHAAARDDLAGLLAGPRSRAHAEYRFHRPDGVTRWVHCAAARTCAIHEGRDVVVVHFQDVTARRDTEAELARLARTDPLTGLLNRHAFTEYVRAAAQGDPADRVGIVFVDLDGFKHVNDVYGHRTGDAVLARVATRILDLLPTPAHAAYRMGGDEFLVVAPNAAPERVADLSDRIRMALRSPYDATPRPNWRDWRAPTR